MKIPFVGADFMCKETRTYAYGGVYSNEGYKTEPSDLIHFG